MVDSNRSNDRKGRLDTSHALFDVNIQRKELIHKSIMFRKRTKKVINRGIR